MKTCKYCGNAIGKFHSKDTCSHCAKKLKLVRRFAVVRDDLRRKLGLPPLEDNDGI